MPGEDRYPRNTADRGLFHTVSANDLDLPPVKAGVIERHVLCLNEVGLAVFAEILLVTGRRFPILDDIFPFFDQVILTRGVLAGHRAVTARTGHAE